MIARADGDVEQLEHSYVVGRSIKGCSHFGKQLYGFFKVNLTLSYHQNTYSKRKENVSPLKDL